MAKKIICDSCGAILPFEKVKDMSVCPVCQASFDDEEEGVVNGSVEQEEEEDLDEGLMYFDEIMTSFKNKPQYNGVIAYCSECKTINHLELDKFDRLVDNEYVILKQGLTIKCRGCGKEHKPRKIFYKKKESYAPPRPHCPACNSIVLKKIKTSSKVLAAATVGVFALPYNSKTFECQNCGYRF